MRISNFKNFKLKMIKKKDVESWISYVRKFSIREAKETRIAAKILVKIIKKETGLISDVPTKEEIKFLKDHSRDLLKILGFIVTRPTPIPYVLIMIALKKFGIDLFPELGDLEIPENYKKTTPKLE